MNGFVTWLNQAISNEFPKEMIAVNFNLYDDGDNQWSVELVGTSSFDAENPDWACDEVFSNRENPYLFIKAAKWNDILDEVASWISEYLNSESGATKIKSYQGIGLGFVDGDITILYKNE